MMIFYIRRNPYGLPILADSELVKTFGRNDFILSVKHYTLIIPLFCKESDHWCYVFVLKYDLLNPQGGEGGGGSTPLYKTYKYVPPQREGFLHLFGLKTGIDSDCMRRTSRDQI